MQLVLVLRTAVYRFYDASGELIYVGVAEDPELRAKQHAKTATWWPEVDGTRTTVNWHDSREAALAEEAQTIWDQRPRHNTVIPASIPEVPVPAPDDVPVLAMSIATLRPKVGDRIDAAHYRDEPTVIMKSGEPRAILVSVPIVRAICQLKGIPLPPGIDPE